MVTAASSVCESACVLDVDVSGVMSRGVNRVDTVNLWEGFVGVKREHEGVWVVMVVMCQGVLMEI